MKRPTEVKIEDSVVKIEWDAKLGRLSEGYIRAGDHSPGKIRIAKGGSRRSDKVLLLHELLHELWVKSNLRPYFSRKTEEAVIDSLAGWLYIMLKDNPELAEFLAEDA